MTAAILPSPDVNLFPAIIRWMLVRVGMYLVVGMLAAAASFAYFSFKAAPVEVPDPGYGRSPDSRPMFVPAPLESVTPAELMMSGVSPSVGGMNFADIQRTSVSGTVLNYSAFFTPLYDRHIPSDWGLGIVVLADTGYHYPSMLGFTVVDVDMEQQAFEDFDQMTGYTALIRF